MQGCEMLRKPRPRANLRSPHYENKGTRTQYKRTKREERGSPRERHLSIHLGEGDKENWLKSVAQSSTRVFKASNLSSKQREDSPHRIAQERLAAESGTRIDEVG